MLVCVGGPEATSARFCLIGKGLEIENGSEQYAS